MHISELIARIASMGGDAVACDANGMDITSVRTERGEDGRMRVFITADAPDDE